MHNEMLQVEGKKMSKSLGNFFTVRDLLDQGVAGRGDPVWCILSTHYSKPMDWTAEKARAGKQDALEMARACPEMLKPGQPSKATVEALADDLNTHAALSELHRLATVLMAEESGADMPEFDVGEALQ